MNEIFSKLVKFCYFRSRKRCRVLEHHVKNKIL